MSKGIGLVTPKADYIKMQKLLADARTQIHNSMMVSSTTGSSSQWIPTVNSFNPPRSMKFMDNNHDLIMEISPKGNLIFYVDDPRAIIGVIERVWKNEVMPKVITQTDIDALAYAAGLYIKDPKDAAALREKAFDRLEELLLGNIINFEADENPRLLRRDI